MPAQSNVGDVRVLRRDDQVQTSMHGGVYRTNKPVVGGRTADGQVSAALFYWSHGRFSDDFEFGLHRHQGFEVMSFVLEGDNAHYDTTTRAWVRLGAGDVQVIRAGSGLAHNERVGRNSQGFQIWFDPGFAAAVQRPPSYTDYPAAGFRPHAEPGASVTDYVGGDGPIDVRTEGLTIRRVALDGTAPYRLSLGPERFSVVYVITGGALVAGADLGPSDALTVRNVDEVAVEGTVGTELMVISVPAAPGYEPVRER